MKIIVNNNQERQLIESMCDIALRSGGIKNLKEVEMVLSSIESPKKKDNEKDKDEKTK